MSERQKRFWQQTSTALFSFTSAILTGGFILTRINQQNLGLALVSLGSILFLFAIWSFHRSLGPKQERWTLAQSIVFVATGKILSNEEAFLQVGFENPEEKNWSPEIKESVFEMIVSSVRQGAVTLEGISIDRQGQPIERAGQIHPALFAANNPQIVDGNNLILQQPVSKNRTAMYSGLVAYSDEIRILRIKWLLGMRRK